MKAFASAAIDAGAGMFLADTLDWLNLWQDNANNDWLDDDFVRNRIDIFRNPNRESA